MKKLVYLIVLVLILGLVLTGCKLLSNISQVPATEQSGISYLTKNSNGELYTEANPFTTDLLAGQSIDVGEVQVWNDAENLHITYLIDVSGWYLTETHLHIACDESAIPQNKKGNPIPGHFDYSSEHEISEEIIEEPFVISLDSIGCCNPYIAAHAVVKKEETTCIDFENYSEKDLVTSESTSNGPVNFYMTSYASLKTLGLDGYAALPNEGSPIVAAPSTTPNPPSDGYANIVAFTIFGDYSRDDEIDDAAGTGADGNTLTDPQDLTKAPLLQHAYAQGLAIVIDVSSVENIQGLDFAAIDLDHDETWYFLYFDEDNKLIYKNTLTGIGQTGDGVAYPIEYGGLVSKVAIFGGMNKGEEDRIGYAIDHVCVTYLVDETAWGFGTRFVDQGNWGTWFNYPIQPVTICIDFSAIGSPGTSIEGQDTVYNGLEINAVYGNAIILAAGVTPKIYGANNVTSGTHGCLDSTGGFSYNCGTNYDNYEYEFTFDVPVSAFSLRMLDFGDYNPSGATNHEVTMTAYNESDGVVDEDILEFTSSTAVNPGKPFGLYLSGDACDAELGEPGNWNWQVSGSGIVRVELIVVEGLDPKIAFDNLCFTIYECVEDVE